MHKNTVLPLSAPLWWGLPAARRVLNNRAPSRSICAALRSNSGEPAAAQIRRFCLACSGSAVLVFGYVVAMPDLKALAATAE
jgi:hypothetical protein